MITSKVQKWKILTGSPSEETVNDTRTLAFLCGVDSPVRVSSIIVGKMDLYQIQPQILNEARDSEIKFRKV